MIVKKIQLILVAAGALIITLQSCSKDVEVQGCPDKEACNFNPEATFDNGSCTYATDWYRDLNGDGLGNPYSVRKSCTKPSGYSAVQCDPITFFQDVDGDGLGNQNVTRNECIEDSVMMFAQGYVLNGDDIIDVNPEVTQRAIMTYVGATWCGPCGAYGDPTKEHLEETYGDSVVILNSQGAWQGDNVSTFTSFGCTFGNNFWNSVGASSAPYHFWSAANYAMTDGGFSSQVTQFDNTVGAILATAPKVGIAGNVSVSNGVVTVNTAVKFVSSSSEHYISVLLLEDLVMADQTITDLPNAITAHNNVVRASHDGSAGELGQESMGTGFLANQLVDATYAITIPTTVVNNANLQVAIVVWDGATADKISNAIILDVN